MARILLVDDEKDLLFVMREYLSAKGFEVELAYSAAQARLYLAHSHFDVVVSDFVMPGESGLDLLDHVSSRYPTLPFILMTGSGMSLLKDEAIKRGSSGYLVKPFQFKDLIDTIGWVLAFSNQGDHAQALTACG